jgi:hypothetical protein
MTKPKCGSNLTSDARDRKPALVKKQKQKKQKQMSYSVALIPVFLIPAYLTVCFLATGMDKGQLKANLMLKLTNWIELKAEITKTTK